MPSSRVRAATSCAVWAAGLGVAVVPAVGPPPPAGTVLRRVVDVDLSLPVGVLSRVEGATPSPALAAFLAELRGRLRDAAGR